MRGIKEAEAGLLEVLEQERELPPHDLRQLVLANSRTEANSLEEGQVSLAFWRLLNGGEIELTDDLTVRRTKQLAA